MEIRQILMVALFMFAAAIMKSAMPSQAGVELSNASDVIPEKGQSTSPKIVTALAPPVAELLYTGENVPAAEQNPDAHLSRSGFKSTPIPGSFIALVVAAMALVSVARRPV